MRYDDDRVLQTSSGYESLGFESFNRDACMCFAASPKDIITASCSNAIDSAKAYADCTSTASTWSSQGTSSVNYVASNIASLENSIKNIKVDAETVGKALKELADKLGYKINDDWTIGLDLKNQFNRDSRLTRSQLKTI